MQKIKIFSALLSLIAVGAFLSFTPKISANGGCIPVYGGGVSCPRPGEILLDKKVRNPSTGVFVDNLGPSDPKYRPTWIITFTMNVRNPGDEILETVTVVDTIPKYMDFMSASHDGKYDSAKRTVTYTIKNLVGKGSQQLELKGRIYHQAALPADKNIICPTSSDPQPINVAEARAGELVDRDESSFCIEKELVVPKVPEAGPEHWFFSSVGILATMTIGLYLRKKAYKKS